MTAPTRQPAPSPTPGPPSAAAAPSPGTASSGTGPAGPPRRPQLRVPAELSLWALTVAAAVGFRRLFTDFGFLPVVLLAVTSSHLLATVLRRRRVPVAVAALVSGAAMVVVLSWVFYAVTTRWGLPTAATWDLLLVDLREAAELFREEQAPVDAVRGFLVGTALGFWVVAFLADWSAFRLWAPAEAVVPAGSMFVFATLLGAEQWRLLATVAFFLTAAGFLLLHRTARLETSRAWIGGDGRPGSRAQLATGAVLAAFAVVAVAVAGPLLPGTGSDPILDVRDLGDRRGTRITLSPLVDIRQRLVDQRDTEVFTVTSPEHAYWRLTALDEFDGRAWRSSKRFEKALGELPPAERLPRSIELVEQSFTISGLSQIWLPAAFEVQAVTDPSKEVRWDPTTATLIADGSTSDGMTYTVRSAITDFSAEDLRAATGTIPASVQDDYLVLPADFPRSVRELATDVTAGAPTAYDAALDLQNWFRTNFTYSTDVPGGQDIDAIEDFVFSEARAGYCEQFAGSFAAMARSLGLPARVAVGFTLGDPDPEAADTYVVKGRHAHAWPEVYLAGVGWLMFEPTPGRGSPNAPYTGTAEQQDSDVAPFGATTTTAPLDPGAMPADPFFEELPGGSSSGGLPADPAGTTGEQAPIDRTGARIVLGILLVALAYVVLVPLVRRTIRATRRRVPHDPAGRIDLAWREATEALHLLGVEVTVGETPAEFARRADRRVRTEGLMSQLAALTTAARYRPDPPSATEAERAAAAATAVRTAVREQTTAGERLRSDLDLRPVLQRGWRSVARGASTDDDTADEHRTLVGSDRR